MHPQTQHKLLKIERALKEAVVLARRQGAKLFELRAYRDLLREHPSAVQGAGESEDLSRCLDTVAEGGTVPEVQEIRSLLA